MSLKQFIETKRPNLSESSVTTYNSVLKNLYKRVFGDEQIDIKKFNNTEPIVNFIKDEPPNKRKSILSALVVVTDNDKYRKLMLLKGLAIAFDIAFGSDVSYQNMVV